MNQYHEVFGYSSPKFTAHLLQRYCERFYNIKESLYNGWIKINHQKIYSEIKKSILSATKLDINSYDFFYKKYGNDVVLLRNNNKVFVVRNNINVVTVFKYNDFIGVNNGF